MSSLKATHTNSFTRVASKGANKGKRFRIHVYSVTGAAKDVAAYNAAQLKAAEERGVASADVPKDKAGNCLFFQTPNWLTGNLAKPELNLTISFNGYVMIDAEQDRMAMEAKRHAMKEENIARIAAELELGIVTRVNAPAVVDTPAATPAGTTTGIQDDIDNAIAEMQNGSIEGEKLPEGAGKETLATQGA